jgi:hypothetical protein
MTNQAKFDDEGYPIKAMRKGNTIKDLTSSNVVLVKPSQDCQAKEEFNGITSTKEYDLWVHKLPKDKLFTIAEVSDIVAVANFWKLQEQAKRNKKFMEDNHWVNPDLPQGLWDNFWEKYGVRWEE